MGLWSDYQDEQRRGAQARPNTAPTPGSASGLLTQGNIDPFNRPRVQNADGTYSTLRTITIGENGRTVLLPTVVNGRVVSPQEAVQHYRKTGQHLGIFKDEASAEVYDRSLHARIEPGSYDRGAQSGPGPAAPAKRLLSTGSLWGDYQQERATAGGQPAAPAQTPARKPGLLTTIATGSDIDIATGAPIPRTPEAQAAVGGLVNPIVQSPVGRAVHAAVKSVVEPVQSIPRHVKGIVLSAADVATHSDIDLATGVPIPTTPEARAAAKRLVGHVMGLAGGVVGATPPGAAFIGGGTFLEDVTTGGRGYEHVWTRGKGYEQMLIEHGVPEKYAKPIAGVLRLVARPENVVPFAWAQIAKLAQLGRTADLAKVAATSPERIAEEAAARSDAVTSRIITPEQARTGARTTEPLSVPERPAAAPVKPVLPGEQSGASTRKELIRPGSLQPQGTGGPVVTPGAPAAPRPGAAITPSTAVEYGVRQAAPIGTSAQKAMQGLWGIEKPFDPGPLPRPAFGELPKVTETLTPEAAARSRAALAGRLKTAYQAAVERSEHRLAEVEKDIAKRTTRAKKEPIYTPEQQRLLDTGMVPPEQVTPRGAAIGAALDVEQAYQRLRQVQAEHASLEEEAARGAAPAEDAYSAPADEWGNSRYPIHMGGGSVDEVRREQNVARRLAAQPDELFSRVAGPEAGRGVRNFVNDRDAVYSDFVSTFNRHGVYPKTLLRRGGMTAQELENLRDVVEGGSVAINPRVQRAADAVRSLFDKYGIELEQRGATVLAQRWVLDTVSGAKKVVQVTQPFKRIKDRFPIRLSVDRIIKAGPQGVLALLKRANPGIAEVELANVANTIFRRATGKTVEEATSLAWDTIQQGTYSTMVHRRSGLRLPDELRHNPYEELIIDASDHAETVAATRHFGPDDSLVQGWVKKAEFSADRQVLEEQYRRMRRIDPMSPIDRDLHAAGDILRNAVAGIWISFNTTIKHLNRPLVALSKMHLEDMARGFVTAFTRSGRLDAEASGMYVRNLSEAYLSIERGEEAMTMGARFARGSRTAASALIKMTGITHMDAHFRATIYHAAKLEIERLRAAALAGNEKALTRLRDHYGFEIDGAGNIAIRPSELYSAEDLRRLPVGARNADEAIRLAASDIANRYSATPGVGREPLFMQSGLMRATRSLNTFTLLYHKLIMREFIGPILQNPRSLEAWGALLKFAAWNTVGGEGLLAAGELVHSIFDHVRSLVTGQPTQNVPTPGQPGGGLSEFIQDVRSGKVPLHVWGERIAADIARAHGLGILSTTVQAIVRSGNIQPHKTWLTTATKQVGKEFIGAGVGFVDDMAKALGEFWGAMGEADRKKREKAFGTTRRDLVRTLIPEHTVSQSMSPLALEETYAAAVARAMIRGDLATARRLRQDYHHFAHKELSDKTITRVMHEMGSRKSVGGAVPKHNKSGSFLPEPPKIEIPSVGAELPSPSQP